MKKITFLILSIFLLMNNLTNAQSPNPKAGNIKSVQNKNYYCFGQTASLTVNGSNGTLTWERSADNSNFIYIGNTTQIDITRNKAANDKDVYYYRTKATLNGNIAYSASFMVTYFTNTNTPGIDFANGYEGYKCGSTEAFANIKTDGQFESLQVFRSYDNINYTSITFSIYQFQGVTQIIDNEGIPVQADQTRYYKVNAKIYTCDKLINVSTPQPYALHIYAAPVGGTLTVDKTGICLGDFVNLNLSQFHGNIIWEVSTDGGKNFNTGINSQSPTLSYQVPYAPQGVPVVIRARLNSGTCQSAISNTVSINVYTKPQVYSINPSATETKCSNSTLTLSASNPQNSPIQWQSSFDGINYTDIAGAVSANYTEQLVNNGTSNINKYYKVKYGSVCTATSPAKLVQIAPSPKAGYIVGPYKVCGTAPYTLTLVDYAGTNITWEYRENMTQPWTLFTTNTNTITTNPLKFMVWRATVQSPACSGAAISTYDFSVEYDPAPSGIYIVPLNQCAHSGGGTQAVVGSPVTLMVQVDQGKIKEFEWQVQYPGTNTWVTYASTPIAMVDIADLPNNTQNIIQYKVRVIAKPEFCSSYTTQPFTVNIYPKASNLISAPTEAICAGAPYYLQTPLFNYDYAEVRYRDAGTSDWIQLSGINAFVLPATTVPMRFVSVTYVKTGCDQNITTETTFVVRTYDPNIEILGDDNFCKGKSDASYMIDNPDPNVYYNWSITPSDAGFFTRTYVTNGVAYFQHEYTGNTATVNVNFTDKCGNNQTVTKDIHLISLPEVSITPLPDQYCGYFNPIELQGTPAGGTYVGEYYDNAPMYPGKVIFAPSEKGYHYVGYTVTDPITGCSNTATEGMFYYPKMRFSQYTTPYPTQYEGAQVMMSAYPEVDYFKALQWQYKAPGDADWKVLTNDGYHTVITDYNSMYLIFVADVAHDGYTYRGVMINNCDEIDVSTNPYTITVLPTSGARLGSSSDPSNNGMAVYPNPSTDRFSLNVVGMEENFKVSISDLQGKVVFESTYSNPEVANLGSDLAEGTYIITVSDSKMKKQELLIKTK